MLPGFAAENRAPPIEQLRDPAVAPRLWLGNEVVTPAHFDESHNLACVVSGRRRFTLFPPEQVANLYVGPLDLSPAGQAISQFELDKYKTKDKKDKSVNRLVVCVDGASQADLDLGSDVVDRAEGRGDLDPLVGRR